MVPFANLDLGYSDAENYKRRQNKDLFNRVFLRHASLDRLFDDTTYFLVGEKGTGKTACAVYIANNELNNISAKLTYIRETEYHKFLQLKQSNQLTLADYTSIWRTILLLLLARKIADDEPSGAIRVKRSEFNAIQGAIDDFFLDAFNLDILLALRITDEPDVFAQMIRARLEVDGGGSRSQSFVPSRFAITLRYIEVQLQRAISAVRTSKRHTIFIDGIDIRPDSIPYPDYRECIAGLANAVWALNNDVFPAIKDPGGQCRVVLLIRPDILESLGLQNTNTKIRDNSAVLDWQTTYPNYRSSNIFQAIDRLLAAQQESVADPGNCWDFYFPFNAPTDEPGPTATSSFVSFLRFSLMRPRDIVAMMSILQDIKKSASDTTTVSLENFNSPAFRKEYASYLLGEVKDQVAFYHTKPEYEVFLKFFTFLGGAVQFQYDEFVAAYSGVMKHLQSIRMEPPEFFDSANRFLQYLFDLNVVGYIEKMESGYTHVHWCHRERTYANIAPKIKSHLRYEVHYGMTKALNLGRRVATPGK